MHTHPSSPQPSRGRCHRPWHGAIPSAPHPPPHLPPLPQVLTPADEVHHTNKHNFKVPFVCGCRDLGEALRRIAEGAAMIRTKVRGRPHPCLA